MINSDTVWIIDDDKSIRWVVEKALQKAGIITRSFSAGKDLFKALEDDLPDALINDIRMPGMDGMSVLKVIKQKWPDTEVVIITGYPSVETAKEAVRLGAFDYLSKPLGPDEVVSVASGAMTQKKWALHKDRAGQNQERGIHAASM